MTFKECVENIRREFPKRYFTITYEYNEDEGNNQPPRTMCKIYLDKGAYKTAPTFQAAYDFIMAEEHKLFQPLINEDL